MKAVAGKPTTVAATVSGNSPTGTMYFYDGSTHPITIVYSGDANNAATTATITLIVSLPPEQLIPILQLLLDE